MNRLRAVSLLIVAISLGPLSLAKKVQGMYLEKEAGEANTGKLEKKFGWVRRAALLGIPMLSLLATSAAWAQKQATSVNKVAFLGAHTLTPGFRNGTLPPGFLIRRGSGTEVGFDIPGVSGNNSPARSPAAGVPTPEGNPIGTGTFFPFPGLTEFDQATAFTGSATGANGAFDPPDQ